MNSLRKRRSLRKRWTLSAKIKACAALLLAIGLVVLAGTFMSEGFLKAADHASDKAVTEYLDEEIQEETTKGKETVTEEIILELPPAPARVTETKDQVKAPEVVILEESESEVPLLNLNLEEQNESTLRLLAFSVIMIVLLTLISIFAVRYRLQRRKERILDDQMHAVYPDTNKRRL